MVLTITNSVAGALSLTANWRSCALLLAVCLPAAMPAAHAQYQPPPPKLTTAPCVPTKKDPCVAPTAPAATPSAAEQFPFPGDAPGKATEPDQPTPAGTSTADKFPFPGEPPAPSPSSSSSSSSSSSNSPADTPPDSDQPPLKDVGSSGLTRTQRRHLPKVEDLDHREEEDLQVSHYYFTTGDFQASYLRAKDAVKTIPDDPEAHFALGQAAQRLKKNDEAFAEYGTYLKLEPAGDKAKAALKALNQLVSK